MTTVKNPLILVYTNENNVEVCQIHPRDDLDHRHFGILICDVVRHVAKCFEVNEQEVWDYVELERKRPSTTITGTKVRPN